MSKKVLYLSFVLVMVVLIAACKPSAPAMVQPAAATAAPAQVTGPGSSWEKVHEVNAFSNNGVGFMDTNVGLSVGRQHAISATTDGGKTWVKAEKATGQKRCLFGMDVVDAQVMVHCGAGGPNVDPSKLVNTLEISTDGGKTWNVKQYPVPDNAPTHGMWCMNVSFIDAKTGWAASHYRIDMTIDGGDTWEEIPLPEATMGSGYSFLTPTENAIQAISLRSATEGYVMDIKGNLYATTDTGKSWTKLASMLKEGEVFPTNFLDKGVIRFSDAEHGKVVLALNGENSSMQIITYVTEDGGKTWASETMAAKSVNSVYLSHDGQYLTVHSDQGMGPATVYQYKP